MHIQYQFLAAMENDRLRTAPRRHDVEEARRDHAARLARERDLGAGRPSRCQAGGLKGGRPPLGKRRTRVFGRPERRRRRAMWVSAKEAKEEL